MKEKIQSQELDFYKQGWTLQHCFQVTLPSATLRRFDTSRDMSGRSSSLYARIEKRLLPRFELERALKSDLAEQPFHYTVQTESAICTGVLSLYVA